MAKKFRSGSGIPGIGYPDPPLITSVKLANPNVVLMILYANVNIPKDNDGNDRIQHPCEDTKTSTIIRPDREVERAKGR